MSFKEKQGACLNGTVRKVSLLTSFEAHINPFPAHFGQASDHFLYNRVEK